MVTETCSGSLIQSSHASMHAWRWAACVIGSEVQNLPLAESVEADALLEEEQEWVDIDSADADNELACTAYVESIMDHLYASEVRPPALGTPLESRQPERCPLRCVLCPVIN